jgi:hypothetical protein
MPPGHLTKPYLIPFQLVLEGNVAESRSYLRRLVCLGVYVSFPFAPLPLALFVWRSSDMVDRDKLWSPGKNLRRSIGLRYAVDWGGRRRYDRCKPDHVEAPNKHISWQGIHWWY